MELRPILRTTTSFGALTQVGWVIWPVKPVPNMTYNVFSGTLDPAQFTAWEGSNTSAVNSSTTAFGFL